MDSRRSGKDTMGLDDIVDKAKDAAGDAADRVKDKAGDVQDAAHDAIHSEQAERISDAVLDGAENAANFVTGGKHDGKIGGIRDNVDAKIGDDAARAEQAGPGQA